MGHFLLSWELCVLPLVPLPSMSLLRQLLLGKCLPMLSHPLLAFWKVPLLLYGKGMPSYLDTAMHSVAFGVFFLQTRVF